MPPPATDVGTKPDARPTPAPGAQIRTCGMALTSAKPLRRSRIYTKTNPVRLGAAVVNGSISPTTLWATGTPTPPASLGTTSSSAAGPDLQDLEYKLGVGAPNDPSANDLFSLHVGGKNSFQIWADAMTPTAQRMTYTVTAWQSQDAYKLSPERRTSATPSTPTNEKYVRFLAASKSVGISLVVTTASDCAIGAIADLLGRQPLVRNGYHITDNTLLDHAKRSQIQDLLVRDGTEIMIAAITSRPDATIDQIVAQTTCSPIDLAACEKVLDDLTNASNAFMAAAGAPTYETLSAGTDPNWAFFNYTPGNVAILLP